MGTPQFLKPWVQNSQPFLILLLFTVLLSAIVQFASFALSQNAVVSSLGAQPEDITFAFQMAYVGIITTLPIQVRLIRYFEFRNYLSVSILAAILLNILCITTNDIVLFFILRFLQGCFICTVAASMLFMLSFYVSAKYKQAAVPSIFYGTLLSSGILIGVVFANVSFNDNWKEIYYYIIAFQFLSLLLVAVCFSGSSGMKRYPLYQLDWTSSLFFLTGASALAYTLVYGSKYDWLSDNRIINAILLVIVFAALYIIRTAQKKRPLISLIAFKSPAFFIGLLLLAIYYGTKESLNLIFGYTANVLQWSMPEVMILGLFNVLGLITFLVISARVILTKKVPVPAFIFTGFMVLLFYHLWMYHILTPDLAFNDLILPMFLQGAASGMLFVPIIMLIMSAIPTASEITGPTIAAFVRMVTLLNVSAGFYNLQLYYNQLFKEGFLAKITILDNALTERLGMYKQLFISKGISPEEAEALAGVNLGRALGIQTQLLSNRAIFLLMAYIILITLAVMLCVALRTVVKKINARFFRI